MSYFNFKVKEFTIYYTKKLGNIMDWSKKFQYNQEWFIYKFISDEMFQQQIETYKLGKDTDIEHYKWAAYKYILAEEDFSNKNRLKQFLELVENDPNEHLFKGAISKLIISEVINKDSILLFPQSRIWSVQSILKKLKDKGN